MEYGKKGPVVGVDERMFKPEEVAERLSVHRTSIYNLINANKLRAVRIGVGGVRPRVRIPESALAEYLRQNQIGL